MRKILISEEKANELFTESMLMDKERGKSARRFRIALKNAIVTGAYEFDANENTIYINGYKYEIGKKFAETNDGEPIPLHYTFNTVQKLIQGIGINTNGQPNLNAEEDTYSLTKQELQEKMLLNKKG